MVRFLFALFDFRIHHFNDDPGTEHESSRERLPLCDAVHLVGAFRELFEDFFLFIIQLRTPLREITLTGEIEQRFRSN